MDSIDAPTLYSLDVCSNRSLSPTGRRVFLLLMSATTLLVAGLAAGFGAWFALPFAGLEIVALLLAFYVVASHDGDYERFLIVGDVVRAERSTGGVVQRFECNRHWTQLVLREQGGRCTLTLRSRGNEFGLGRLMSDADRTDWTVALRQWIRVVRE